MERVTWPPTIIFLCLVFLVSEYSRADAVFNYLDKHFDSFEATLPVDPFSGGDKKKFACAQFSESLSRKSDSDSEIPRASVVLSQPSEMDTFLLRRFSGGFSSNTVSVDIRSYFGYRQTSPKMNGGSAEVRFSPEWHPVLRFPDGNGSNSYLWCERDRTLRIPVPCGWGLTSWGALRDECGKESSRRGQYARLYQGEDGVTLFASVSEAADFDYIFTNVIGYSTYEVAKESCSSLDLPKDVPEEMKLAFRLPTVGELKTVEDDFTSQRPYELLPEVEYLWTSTGAGFLWQEAVAFSPFGDNEIEMEEGRMFRFVCIADRPD